MRSAIIALLVLCALQAFDGFDALGPGQQACGVNGHHWTSGADSRLLTPCSARVGAGATRSTPCPTWSTPTGARTTATTRARGGRQPSGSRSTAGWLQRRQSASCKRDLPGVRS
jgi:hypothetical protein